MTIRTLTRALVLTAALSGPATAAVYVGNWDPQFGAPFADNFYWQGSAAYSVPDSCEPAGTATVDNATDCGGAAAVTSATVELFDPTPTGGLLATLVFTPASMLVSTLAYVDGALTGLDTTLSAYATPVVETGVDLGLYGVFPSTTFALQFTVADGPLLFFQTTCPAPPTDCVGQGSNNSTDFPPRFSITRVPEPASVALAGLALTGLAALRRRRPDRSR